ncbi:MAG: O-methyltransferase [Bacteroidetes bacterium]|nr:O-methyltransferase [Bacteroidota bacterium]
MAEITHIEQIEYLRRLRTPDDPLITEMESFAAANKVPILDWKSAELLELIIQIQKPKNVLEIGTAIGYSSIKIARLLRKNASLNTIEKSKPNIKLAKGFIKRAKLGSVINIIEGDALKIMPRLDKVYDFIFLDADKQDYEKLFLLSLMILKKGGVIFVDNLLWKGYAAAKSVPTEYQNSTRIIREFNNTFLNSTAIKSAIMPVGDGIGIGIKV